MANELAFIGLFLTLIGACLLFFYGLPRKKVGNRIIWGDIAIKYAADPNERDAPDSEWQPIATKFLKRAKKLNGTGFALIAVGTLLQMVAICLGLN